jgi:hypothetical protein
MSPGLKSAACLLLALPFGWGAGVLAAYAIGGQDFGQLPVATVPLGILGAIVFSVWPSVETSTRLKIMCAGTAIFIALAWFVA